MCFVNGAAQSLFSRLKFRERERRPLALNQGQPIPWFVFFSHIPKAFDDRDGGPSEVVVINRCLKGSVPLFSPFPQEFRGVSDAAHLEFLRNPARGTEVSRRGGQRSLFCIHLLSSLH